MKWEILVQNDPNALSGGQRQKVAFASIIAMDTDTFVIDEPTSQLDPDGTAAIFEIIHKLKELGKTIILVEHKIDLIAQYADEILALEHGEVAAKGSTKDVLSDFSLLDRGVMLPHTALFYKEFTGRGHTMESVPVTKDECIDQLKPRLL